MSMHAVPFPCLHHQGKLEQAESLAATLWGSLPTDRARLAILLRRQQAGPPRDTVQDQGDSDDERRAVLETKAERGRRNADEALPVASRKSTRRRRVSGLHDFTPSGTL